MYVLYIIIILFVEVYILQSGCVILFFHMVNFFGAFTYTAWPLLKKPKLKKNKTKERSGKSCFSLFLALLKPCGAFHTFT